MMDFQSVRFKCPRNSRSSLETFITSGAVCGNWWKGLWLGNPEGFAMLTVKGENISWRYETYGFVPTPEAAALTTM
jgi:hypothetical protein